MSMNALEYEYLQRNNFKKHGDHLISIVVENGQFLGEHGFHDEKQIAFIKTQFADGFERHYLEDICIVVKPVNQSEYDVSLKWSLTDEYGDSRSYESSIGGDDLYDLVSQAIVLARVDSVNQGE